MNTFFGGSRDIRKMANDPRFKTIAFGYAKVLQGVQIFFSLCDTIFDFQ